MRSRISLLFATACYVGMIPGAPGTYASLATTIAYFAVFQISHRIHLELFISSLCLISALGALAATDVARDRGIEDPSIVVIDEVAGQLLTFFLIPVTPLFLTAGFVLFRIMDIVKPFPIRKLEHLPGGIGIMADDLLAGIYANVCLQLAARWIHF